MIKEVAILDKQTIFDIAVQKYGNVDAIFKLLSINKNLGLEKQLVAGSNIMYEEVSDKIASYLVNKNIATDLTKQEYYDLKFADMIIPELTLKTRRYKGDAVGTPQNVPDSLLAKWQSVDKRFLSFNPEIWMFIEKRRVRYSTSDYVEKSFGHCPHNNGVKFPNSRFYSGEAVNHFGKTYNTEFTINRNSGEYIHLPINIFDYFKYNNGAGWQAINENTELSGTDISAMVNGNYKSKSLAIKFAVVVDNPDKSSKFPKLIGAMSNTVTMKAFKCGGDKGHIFIYKITDK